LKAKRVEMPVHALVDAGRVLVLLQRRALGIDSFRLSPS
jgi:hypothetical protein